MKIALLVDKQPVEVADIRLVVADEVEIAAGCAIVEDQRVLLVGQATQVEPPVETDKDAVVQPTGEARRGEGDLGGAFALGARVRIGPRLEGCQGRDRREARRAGQCGMRCRSSGSRS